MRVDVELVSLFCHSAAKRRNLLYGAPILHQEYGFKHQEQRQAEANLFICNILAVSHLE